MFIFLSGFESSLQILNTSSLSDYVSLGNIFYQSSLFLKTNSFVPRYHSELTVLGYFYHVYCRPFQCVNLSLYFKKIFLNYRFKCFFYFIILYFILSCNYLYIVFSLSYIFSTFSLISFTFLFKFHFLSSFHLCFLFPFTFGHVFSLMGGLYSFVLHKLCHHPPLGYLCMLFLSPGII